MQLCTCMYTIISTVHTVICHDDIAHSSVMIGSYQPYHKATHSMHAHRSSPVHYMYFTLLYMYMYSVQCTCIMTVHV